MRLNTALLKWGFRRVIAGQAIDVTKVASRSWEICRSETLTLPPAIHLDGTMDRIVGLSPWRNWKTERLLIEGGQGDHAASRAHLIENADLCGAFLYCGAAKAQPGFGPRQLVQKEREPVQRLEVAHLMSSWAGSAYFANYMQDVLPLQLLPPEDDPCITVVTKSYEHEAGYRDLLSLPRPPRVVSAHVKRLISYTDFAQNNSKLVRYRTLRQRVRAHFAGYPRRSPPGVYLKRGETGERRIVTNEADLEQALSALGFDIVEPAKLVPSEVAQRMLETPIVIGVEGSHLAHAIYTIADHGTMLVIHPPDRFAMTYKEFTDRLDMKFAFVVGHPAKDGFTVDIDEIKRILEILL